MSQHDTKPDYRPRHQRQPRRHRLRWVAAGCVAAVAFIALLAGILGQHSASPGTSTVSKAPVPAKTSHSPAQPHDSTGKVGDSFTVSASNPDGTPVQYQVTLTAVDQHAAPSTSGLLENPADHMAAVRFKVTGIHGAATDDALADAVGLLPDTGTVTASLFTVKDGASFNSGTWNVSPAQSQSGWVPFEVPPGKKLARVQWVPDTGLGAAAAVWVLP